jgi:hypothetical protein
MKRWISTAKGLSPSNDNYRSIFVFLELKNRTVIRVKRLASKRNSTILGSRTYQNNKWSRS